MSRKVTKFMNEVNKHQLILCIVVAKALVQNLLAFAKGVFAKCILRRHNNFNFVAALVLGRLLLRALRNCEKIMH